MLSYVSARKKGNSKDGVRNLMTTTRVGRGVALPHFGYAEVKGLHQEGIHIHFGAATT